jgi:DNA-binding NtrC family response regulator
MIITRTILIVDDDPAITDILTKILTDEDYAVEEAVSMATAIAKIKIKPYDLYLIDYKLPDGTGLQIAQHLRSTGSLAPILLISGYQYQPSDLPSQLEELQIPEIIEKPFSKLSVCSAVQKAINASFKTSPSPVPSPDQQRQHKLFPTKLHFPRPSVVITLVVLTICAALIFYFVTR